VCLEASTKSHVHNLIHEFLINMAFTMVCPNFKKRLKMVFGPITGVAPGTMGQRGPRPCRRKPNLAWDVFWAVVLWQIWCARCNMVFANEPMNSFQIYLDAWRDTILAGMARRSTILKTLHCSIKSKQANIVKEFSVSWCKNSVFCSGGLKFAKWHLTPRLVDCVPALH
jgi:hypothetical protein